MGPYGELYEEYDRLCVDEIKTNLFHDAATMLYQVHGRRWMGSYEPLELLCATCFLKREKYIEENRPLEEQRFTPMPETFRVFSPEDITSTL